MPWLDDVWSRLRQVFWYTKDPSLTYPSHFGPTSQPRLMIGFRNQVQVDRNGLVQISSVNTFKHTVGSRTWNATMKYAQSLKENNIRIAFFNATPQGGGVALMRHALIRYLNLIGVQCTWSVCMPLLKNFSVNKTQACPSTEPGSFQDHEEQSQHPARSR
jgi:hypothetical protein